LRKQILSRREKALLGVFVLFVAILMTQCSGGDDARTRSGIVSELVVLVSTDNDLRQKIETALDAQPEKSYWHGKGLDSFYDFFDEWLVFLATPDNARQYMDAFDELANSETGREFVGKVPFRNWLYEFMKARGRFMDSEESAKILPSWLSNPSIHMDDFIIPEGGFRSFNEFFTRNIKPGARPIDSKTDPSVFTSPADCYLMPIDDQMTAETTIDVKGDSLNIHDLLGGDPLSGVFINGTAVLCMLDTPNYHHFHSPVQGTIVSAEQLAGLYFGMTGDWIPYFYQHRRGYFIFDTREFGYVGMVPVGMFDISSIRFAASRGDVVSKGDELGNFAYGGSAIVLLFEPGRITFSVPMQQGPVAVLMGQAIGSAADR
jgi:phosphatidylserine decarboxylase